MNTTLPAPAACSACGFSTTDLHLLARHSCAVTSQGGRCEDFPACGHEAGDCNGLLYGSDEAIKESVYRAIATGHGECAHEEGLYNCYADDYDDDMEDEPEPDDRSDEDEEVDGPHFYCDGPCCTGS